VQGGGVERLDPDEHHVHPGLGQHGDGGRSEGFGANVDTQPYDAGQVVAAELVEQCERAPPAVDRGAAEVGVREGEPGGAGQLVQVRDVRDSGVHG